MYKTLTSILTMFSPLEYLPPVSRHVGAPSTFESYNTDSALRLETVIAASAKEGLKEPQKPFLGLALITPGTRE
jgi:hypothetical protein